MKIIVSIACLLVIVSSVSAVEARPKRSVVYAAAPAVVATVPVVKTATVVHSNPTTVVKTEQVHSGDHASYSYSSEVRSQPVVHQQVVHQPVVHQTAAVAAVAAPVVSTVHHTVPTYAYGYYPSAAYYHSPYYHVVG